MRKPYLLLAFVPAAIVWACGGDDSGVPDGGQDATTDSAGGDASKDSSTTDSSSTDGSSNDGGPSDAGQKDVSVTLDCLKPADCVDGGDPDAAYPPADAGVVCCATVVTSGPNIFSCKLDSISSACAAPAACASNVSFSSCGTETLRACKFTSECTEAQYNLCCAFQTDAGTAHVCANTAIAQALNGTCN